MGRNVTIQQFEDDQLAAIADRGAATGQTFDAALHEVVAAGLAALNPPVVQAAGVTQPAGAAQPQGFVAATLSALGLGGNQAAPVDPLAAQTVPPVNPVV